MIHVIDKHKCCGCTACAERCPKQCITMQEDVEGFLYPDVDTSLCIDCSLCEKVCPVLNQSEEKRPSNVYASKNPNEGIRMKSSSGGIFSMLAERTIKNGGLVFGVKFNNQWEVVHDFAETIEGIDAFRGSKYVQSRIGDNYKKAEAYLKAGRVVLFSGTPCQIAGFHKFLFKEYKNLITVDVVCHGVPSPLVWRDYLLSLNAYFSFKEISFRDKVTGWKSYSTKYSTDNEVFRQLSSKDIYMCGFLKDLYLRPSCENCPAKSGKSRSDITIADFWGIANFYPKFDDDKGCGLIFTNTEKGQIIYDSLDKSDIKVEYSQALAGNPSIEHSVVVPPQRNEFWKRYKTEGVDCILPICNTMRPSLPCRAFNLLKRIVKRVLSKVL